MVKKEEKKQKRESEKEVDLELRPHHVLSYAGHEAQPGLYSLPDEQYIIHFREEKRKSAEDAARKEGRSEKDIRKAGEYAYNFHSDELISHWRASIKRIHDNPDTKFRYVAGLDSICKKCDQKAGCHDKNHWAYKVVQQADSDAVKWMPELKHGKVYDRRYLRRLFKKKGWLKEQKQHPFPFDYSL